MTEPPKLVRQSISIERMMQEHGRVCLQLKFTEEQLEGARTAIENLQKALAESQEKLASYEQKETPVDGSGAPVLQGIDSR